LSPASGSVPTKTQNTPNTPTNPAFPSSKWTQTSHSTSMARQKGTVKKGQPIFHQEKNEQRRGRTRLKTENCFTAISCARRMTNSTPKALLLNKGKRKKKKGGGGGGGGGGYRQAPYTPKRTLGQECNTVLGLCLRKKNAKRKNTKPDQWGREKWGKLRLIRNEKRTVDHGREDQSKGTGKKRKNTTVSCTMRRCDGDPQSPPVQNFQQGNWGKRKKCQIKPWEKKGKGSRVAQ